MISAGTQNCATCIGLSTEWVGLFSTVDYSPPKLVCGSPYKSDFQCLTSSQYVQTIWATDWTYVISGNGNYWLEGTPYKYTYNPCYTDDTVCWNGV